MEFTVFGEGWLGEILGAAGVSGAIRERVRNALASLAEGERGAVEAEWKSIDRMLKKGRLAEALGLALETVSRTAGELRALLGQEAAVLERPLSPFLIGGGEVRKVLYAPEDVRELARSGDELDALRALVLINGARRLLVSWGAGVGGKKPRRLIPRLEKDVEDLRRMQAELPGEDEFGEDLEREMEFADRFASTATRFARDLMELHVSNTAHPEVRRRFEILWNNVLQLAEDGDMESASLEALQVLEEAFELAGMGGGDTLEKVDLLYGFFSEVEGLRRAVDRLTAISRDGEGSMGAEEGRACIEAIRGALADMGLELA
ncbi:MAG: hypothetical protein H5T74_04085 [Actinobacteria bacterium]|nr:hypothetical protein [Actinomycetota bacterium]MDI6829796.1 hypothetical protein [Actinomycetota bacterium]